MVQRVLVIGACGFIGQAVVAAFRRKGIAVTGFDLAGDCDAFGGGIETVTGSVTDRVALSEAVRRVEPCAIVSLAAFSRPATGLAISAEADRDAAFAVNVDGLRNVVESGLEHGVPRIVWSSSTVALGRAAGNTKLAVDERAIARPCNIYGLTKALAEQISVYAHDVMGVDIAAVRPTLVLGPRHPYSGVLDPLKRVFAHRPEDGPVALSWDSRAFDIVHVEDVAAAFLTLCLKPERLSALYHVNGGATEIVEIIDIVTQLRPGLDVRLSKLEADAVYPLVSSDRMAAETGFMPRFSPRDIVADCARQADWGKGGANAGDL